MGRKGKAFCERPFALHHQQPEKDKQNFDAALYEKFLRTPLDQAYNQRGAIGKLPPLKFSQTYVFVRYSSKLHHFAPTPRKYQLVAALPWMH